VAGLEGAEGDLGADEAGRAGDEDCRHFGMSWMDWILEFDDILH
jgi:hypothetical protein